jgi:hypothetical protein
MSKFSDDMMRFPLGYMNGICAQEGVCKFHAAKQLGWGKKPCAHGANCHYDHLDEQTLTKLRESVLEGVNMCPSLDANCTCGKYSHSLAECETVCKAKGADFKMALKSYFKMCAELLMLAADDKAVKDVEDAEVPDHVQDEVETYLVEQGLMLSEEEQEELDEFFRVSNMVAQGQLVPENHD